MRKLMLLLVLILAASCFAGCQTATPTPDASTQTASITVATTPDPPMMGDSTMTITVTQAGAPLANAPVSVRGDINHAGMKPVLADGTTNADGALDVPFAWSMGGDWIVTVTVTLPDGSEVSQDFDYTISTDMNMGS